MKASTAAQKARAAKRAHEDAQRRGGARFVSFLKANQKVGGQQEALEFLATHIGWLNADIERLRRELATARRQIDALKKRAAK